MFKVQSTCVGHHYELPEVGHGIGDLSNESLLFLLNLQNGSPGQLNVKDSLNWVLVNLENVRELEDENIGFVLFEAKAVKEEAEARDWEGVIELGENEVLKFQDFAVFLLDFHVVVIAMVMCTLKLFGDRGRLRHGSCGSDI
nr:hypothetical protein CFP56_13981 [Quercus suber]